jgi:hypothetical protein
MPRAFTVNIVSPLELLGAIDGLSSGDRHRDRDGCPDLWLNLPHQVSLLLPTKMTPDI